MNWFKKVFLWFKTHNKVVVKEAWDEMYIDMPQKIKDIYCQKCWHNLFDVIDTDKDNTITMWELLKYSISFGYKIYKHFKK